MPRVGDRVYTSLSGLPTCARDGCSKPCRRWQTSVMSRWCSKHEREECDRLMASGLRFDQVKALFWAERPRVRLVLGAER